MAYIYNYNIYLIKKKTEMLTIHIIQYITLVVPDVMSM